MIRRKVDFLVDAQLPPALARAIADAGYTAQHVADVGLLHAADVPIWNFACEHGCVLITKDEDFAAIRRRSKRGASVVWLRLPNTSRLALLAWFIPRLPQVIALVEGGEPLIELR